MISKNKRGFLLAEETVKIVIALICIVFLAYLLFSIYNANVEKKEMEFARASLKSIIENMNAKSPEVEIFNPVSPSYEKAFYLVSWSSINGPVPTLCENIGWNNCLCICKNKIWRINADESSLREDCSDWACEQTDIRVITNLDSLGIKIENPPITLELDSKENTIIRRK